MCRYNEQTFDIGHLKTHLTTGFSYIYQKNDGEKEQLWA